jgi:hypothetical protein
MAEGPIATKESDLVDLLVAELKHLEETGQRRTACALTSPTSSDYFKAVISMDSISPERRAEMAIEVIRNSYLDGYNEGVNLAQLRRFCTQHDVKPSPRLQSIIEYGLSYSELKRTPGKASQ